MKTSLGLVVVLFLVGSLQFASAFETKQEPKPPEIPEPSPAPGPILLPNPVPVPEPFPRDIESEQIQRLTKENNKLKQQNVDLRGEISALKNEKSRLQAEISKLDNLVENLKAIAIEQVKVIMDLVNKLEDVSFEKILSPVINL